MSLNLYQEAIVEAKQLREMAEQNAKNKIIDAVTPKIRELIEQQLVGDDDEESELIIGDELTGPPVDMAEPMAPDEEILDLSGLAADIESVGDELVDDEEDDSSAVSITVQGDLNMSLDESDDDDDLLLSKEGASHLNSFLREYARNKSINSRLALLESKVNRFKKDLSYISLNKTSPINRQIVATYYANLLREVNSLTDQVIFINESVDERLEKRLLLTLKEIKNMSKRRDARIFRRLFEELADEGLREMGLSEQDEEVLAAEEEVDVDMEEVPEEVDAVAAQDALEPLATALGFEVTPVEEEEVEVDEEELDLELEEGDDADDEAQNEVYEIDEAAIRRELRRLRVLREQDSEVGRAADADPALAHGGDDEGDLFVDVNEDDLLNALADELGDPGVPEPTVESRRRRARRTRSRSRRMAETRRSRRRSAPRSRVVESRRNRAVQVRAVKAEKTARHLRRQLQEMNLFNAKLLFANKLMQNRELSTKQQRTIVEALDKATNIREAKLLYKSLSSSLHKSRGSLTESRTRLLASSSRSTRSGSPTNNGSDTDRWALLAGISNKK
ncbi:hypothetical protein CL634_06105 [bacterium]|nr:hypothetical protein [bacterium]